jgi:hypothetical protein
MISKGCPPAEPKIANTQLLKAAEGGGVDLGVHRYVISVAMRLQATLFSSFCLRKYVFPGLYFRETSEKLNKEIKRDRASQSRKVSSQH